MVRNDLDHVEIQATSAADPRSVIAVTVLALGAFVSLAVALDVGRAELASHGDTLALAQRAGAVLDRHERCADHYTVGCRSLRPAILANQPTPEQSWRRA